MAIRVSNLRLPVDEPEAALPARLAAALGIAAADIARWRILRKSLDLRDKRSLAFVYSAEVVVPQDEAAVLARSRRGPPGVQAVLFEEPSFEMPPPGDRPLRQPPVIVGTGPAGLVAGYFLARHGYRPILCERGRAVRDRIRDVEAFESGGPPDPESNYLFGEGGAGTFSDGKLTCRLTGPDVQRVLELLAECKGKPSILYEHRPHLGSNRLPAVVKALRQRIERYGGQFRFDCRVEDLEADAGQVRGLATSSGPLSADVVLLAIGHSARDTYEMLVRRGVPMVQKPFQIGVRVEHPQALVNRVQYGDPRVEALLGAADYSLVAHGSQDLFSFCMCAGGQVIPSVSEPGHFSTNGMSLSRRDSPYANSGLMITLDPRDFGGDDLLAGMRLQRTYEARAYRVGRGEYACPIQWARDFLAGRPSHGTLPSSYRRALAPGSLVELLPPQVTAALTSGLPLLDARWQGRFVPEATLAGPEARGSAPVRLLRDPQSFEAPGWVGLYPVGEGAGYAGGIVSAAVDGLRAAREIIRRYAPLESSAAE